MSAKPKILIVDDSKTVRAHLRNMLQGSVQALEASNGREALALIAKERPTLILLDHFMPEMNGTDVIQALQQDPDLAKIPVVLMSARPEELEDQLATVLSQVEFLSKPFEPSKLLRASHAAMKKSRTAIAASATNGTDESSPAATELPAQPQPAVTDALAALQRQVAQLTAHNQRLETETTQLKTQMRQVIQILHQQRSR